MNNIKNFFKTFYVYILSFFIPLIILIVIFKESNIYPFGDYSYLNGDLYSQYLPFLENFQSKLLNGSSLDYTWTVGLGTGYRALYAYYLASPLNWFIAFFTTKYIIDIPDILILLKLSLCGVSFSYFLNKRYNEKNFLVPAISICYALSSYMCTYCFNIIWLDCLLLFPLVIVGIEQLYFERKYKLYFFTLFLSILSNYYLGLIICIFLFIYFIFMIIFDEQPRSYKKLSDRIRLFITYSILAGTTTFAITLPAVYRLGNSSSGEFSFPKTLKFYISILDMMIRPLILAPKEIGDQFPNLFCSVIILLIVPLYIFNKKISLKSKLKNMILIAFMLFSFNCNITDYIWHGFHFPNCICARNSFIYIFLVLMITYEGLININSLKGTYLITGLLITLTYIFAIWKFQINTSKSTVLYKESIVYLSLFFIIVYTFILILIRGFSKHSNIIYILLIICVSYELYMNAGVAIGSTHTRSTLISTKNEITELINSINKTDSEFYRIEKPTFTAYNDGASYNYNSTSIFSSTANNKLVDFYKAIGLENSTNIYNSDGTIPIINSLFSVKYVINTDDNYSISENKYNFSLGFMANTDFESKINLNEKNPFINLNNIYKSLSNDNAELYSPIDVHDNINSKTFITKTNEDVYLMCYPSPDYIELTIKTPDGNTESKEFFYILKSYISYVGKLPAGTKISVNFDRDDLTSDDYTLYAYSYNDGLIKNCYNNLKNGFLHIDNYTDTSISGTIDAGDGGLMFTSIPADNGWTAYVDGKKTNIHAFKDAFISLKLRDGKHSIELKYKTPGGTLGMIISLISVTLFISLEIINHRRSKTAELS